MKLWEERLEDSHHDLSWDEKLKNGLGECQVILVAEGKTINLHIKSASTYLVPVHVVLAET